MMIFKLCNFNIVNTRIIALGDATLSNTVNENLFSMVQLVFFFKNLNVFLDLLQ